MTIQKYFKHFDNTFDTHISDKLDISELPMLKMAFENMSQYFYNISDDKKEITREIIEIENQLLPTLNNEQRNLFNEYEENENISVTEICRQMLVFGYSIAYQELKEMDALK